MRLSKLKKIGSIHCIFLGLAGLFSIPAHALELVAESTTPKQCFPQRCLSPENKGQCKNVNSYCYEVNQTFDGQSFFKDNNI